MFQIIILSKHFAVSDWLQSPGLFFKTNWLLGWFQLIQIFDALPTQWRISSTSCGPKSGKTVILHNQIKLYLKTQAVQIENVFSKNVYSEIRARYETRPTAQERFEKQFP